MNILIYGNVASGKTLLAELLQEYYEREGQRALTLKEALPNPARLAVAAAMRATVLLLVNTLHDPRDHTIITTQVDPATLHQYYGLVDKDNPDVAGESLFDYHYHLTRSSHA